ncbi:MAG TPA: type II toxin-antitoxin system VapC family toxin [Rhizomicrobium sp.]|nr:type II toxin-antitoxin system VapC family toxin [Rhizomicrobium sp.]
MTPLLLDTCAAIWLAEDQPMAKAALAELDKAASQSSLVFVSPMTAWEVGLLNARGRFAMSMSPQAWFEALLSVPGVALADLSPHILIASSFLPGSPPRDPADRIVVATAREHGLRLMTRDKVLLDYGKDGHLDVLAC